jgi:hypothetical protein
MRSAEKPKARGSTNPHRVVLGALVLALNGAVYGWLWWKRRRSAESVG